jgi:hypothetical protein
VLEAFSILRKTPLNTMQQAQSKRHQEVQQSISAGAQPQNPSLHLRPRPEKVKQQNRKVHYLTI